MVNVCNLKRFDPPNPHHPLFLHIQGIKGESTGLSFKELFAAVQDSLNGHLRFLLFRESEKAGYAPDEYLGCFIRWVKLWDSIGDNDGFDDETGGND